MALEQILFDESISQSNKFLYIVLAAVSPATDSILDFTVFYAILLRNGKHACLLVMCDLGRAHSTGFTVCTQMSFRGFAAVWGLDRRTFVLAMQ